MTPEPVYEATITIEVGPIQFFGETRGSAKRRAQHLKNDLDGLARLKLALGPYSKAVKSGLNETKSYADRHRGFGSNVKPPRQP